MSIAHFEARKRVNPMAPALQYQALQGSFNTYQQDVQAFYKDKKCVVRGFLVILQHDNIVVEYDRINVRLWI